MVKLDSFDEIVLADFEFNGGDGNRPNVVSLVAYELRSGRKFRLWYDELGSEPPFRCDDKTLFVAYYASAELGCHLALGWPMPRNILDLFTEFRCLTNHSSDHQPAAGLLNAMDHFKLDAIEARAKDHWQTVVLRGGPWSAEERAGILEYNETDVVALEKLLPAMPIPNLGQALLRSNYMRAEAWMKHWGIPVDKPLVDDLAAHWGDLRRELIDDLNVRYPFFDGPVFKRKQLERWLIDHDIRYWPLTPTGQISTDAETLRAMAARCPEVAEFCHTKTTLEQLKAFTLSVGDDGRNRCMLSAFRSKTGRNQPSTTAFVFGLHAAFRSLIRPEPGNALAYLDFSGQEFAEAAYFSGDQNMIAAYESGDPYSDWARKSGAMPPDGNKKTHPHVRAMFKRASLGVLYGMGARTLSGYVGVSEVRARQLLRSHRDIFSVFWRWSDAVYDAGVSTRMLQTTFGFQMKVLPTVKPGTLLNWPMQANGADMLRLACCLATNRGIKIIAPIHDAILVEGPVDSINDVIADLKVCMIEASRAVLGGPTVRVDANIIPYPERYVDDRDMAPELWATTMRLIEKLKRRVA